jgi:hypothetical protein
MTGKYDVGLFGLILSAISALACGAAKPEMAPRAATAPEPAQRSGATSLDTSALARERLGLLQREMQRVASRLEQEGTPEQRALWQGELGDIGHDCVELASEWQEAERMAQPDRAAEHARLVPLIDVLYAVNARTAAQIDRSIDAAGK